MQIHTIRIENIAANRPGAIKIGPFGSQLKKEDLSSKGFKVYGQENVITGDFSLGDRRINRNKFVSLSSCQLFPGDIIVSMMGTIGKCAVFPKDAEVGIMDSHLLRIQVDDRVADRDYVAGVLSNDEIVGRQIDRLSHGSIMSGLSSAIVKSLTVPLPPLPEQRRIAEILDTIDEAIQKTEVLIAKLKAMKQGLLHDLLTRGLDENGKLRDPKAHPEKFKGSSLGLIPRAWDETRVGEMGTWRGGSTPSKAVDVFWKEGDILWVTPKDFSEETLSNSQDKVTRRAVEQTGLALFNPDDIAVVFRSGVLRHSFPVAVVTLPFTVNQDIKVLSKLANYDHRFAFFLLKSLESNVLRYAVKAGTTVESIGFRSFSSIRVVKPPLNEQVKIAAMLDTHDARIRTEEQYFEKLKLQKKGLMHDLLTGKVRVNMEESSEAVS